MKKMILILPFLFAVSCGDVYAEGIPFKPQTDVFQVGKDGSTDDKEVIFNTGDGASNPALTVDGVAKTFDLNKALGITGDVDATGAGSVGGDFVIGGNNLDVGDGTETDQFVNFNISGGESVGFKYDSASGEVLQKKKAGDAYKKLGTGTGGGGGANFNNAFTEDDNPNAEDGTTGWTASAGTFDVDSTDPLEGDQSFIWTPAAQNDTVTSPVLDFDQDKFKGRACQAQIDAIGGDENLTVQVIDGNSDVVGEKQYSAQSLAAPFSVYFRCPSQAKITADSEKGNLRLRLINSGASASPLIKWDKSYSGTLIGLSETVLPDVLRVNIENDGVTASAKTGESAPDQWWDSITRDSEGIVIINYSSLSLNEVPSFNVTTINNSEWQYKTRNETTSTVEVTSSNSDGSAFRDSDFSFVLFKNGTDAKQAVQVYKSIPKVSENVNRLEGLYDSTEATLADAVKKQTPSQWITNTAKSGTNDLIKTFTVKSGVFSETPNCIQSGTNDTAGGSSQGVANYVESASSPTSLVFHTTRADSIEDLSFNFSCTKAPDDYKLPTVQPIVLPENAIFFEGETDSLIGGYASFGGASDGDICSTSPCTRYREFGDLASNMSTTRTSGGRYTLAITGFKPNSNIYCNGSSSGSSRTRDFEIETIDFQSDVSGDASVDIEILSAAGSLQDGYFQVYCIGPKPL